MKNLLITIIGIAIGMPSSYGQTNGTIRGGVYDKETEETLVGVKILLKNDTNTVGVISDSTGNFRLQDLSPGRYDLTATSVGYRSKEVQNILVTTGKEMVMEIKMTPSISELSTVVVRPNSGTKSPSNLMASVSNRTITLEETERFAGTAGDPSRLVASFAGVNAVDGDNDLIIRGNSPVGMLWQMEGIEIPNPNHFSSQGSSGGPISMLNSNVLSNSTFYTGAFPAEYGNGFSGVFDVKLRQGNDKKREHAFKIGVLGTDFSSEGPFMRKINGSYLVNYRYSTLAILNKIGINIAGDVVPDYQDLTYNIKVQDKKLGKINLFGLLGSGTAQNSWHVGENELSDTYKSELAVSGLKYRKSLGSNTFLQLVGAFTSTRRTYSRFSMNTVDLVSTQTYQEKFVDPSFKLRGYLSHRFNSKHHLSFGGIWSYIQYDHFSAQINDNGLMLADQDGRGNGMRYQGHFQWKFRMNTKFQVMTGAHYTYFHLTKEHRLEPRIAARIEIDQNSELSIGYGRHSKTWDLGIYNVQLTDDFGNSWKPNKTLEMLDAHHFVVAYDRQFLKNWYFRIETYFQHLKNVPVGNDSSSVTSLINLKNYYPKEKLINQGTGFNYGSEITLERSFKDHWFLMLTASVFDSKFKAQDKEVYNTRWNNNYIFNIQGGREFVLKNPNHSISMNTKFVWSGGNRYTPIDLAESIDQSAQVYEYEKVYSHQFPDYLRLDLKLSYRFNAKRTTHSVILDIQNATNRMNTAGQYFDSESNEISRTNHLGIVPVLSYKILF
jgi:hypothetical protein